jgi:hypothetical protein
MTVTRASTPNLVGQPSVNFRQDDFHALIWNKGYDVILEEAVECPCSSEGSGARSTCLNCMGRGWFFIAPIQTRAILTSINKDTKYKAWSSELLGTISVTVREQERLGFMHRITLINTEKFKNRGIYSEILPVRSKDSDPFVFLTYKPTKIKHGYIYNGDDQPLIKLTENELEISTTNPYVVNINYDFSLVSDFNSSISISYEHELQYHVIDLPHDLRNSLEVDSDGKDKQILLPINAIARKVHNVFGVTNRDGSGLIINE